MGFICGFTVNRWIYRQQKLVTTVNNFVGNWLIISATVNKVTIYVELYMWLYLIIFAIPLFAFLRGNAVNRSKRFLISYTAFLALFVGIADMLGGYDRYIYGEVFDLIADDVTNGSNVFVSPEFQFFEIGYSFLTFLIALVTENRYIYLFIVILIVFFNLYKTFERHFTNYPFAFILFLGMTFFFTFTYLRQVVAFSFAWLSIKYLLEDKKWKFFILLAIVVLMHKAGIVFAGLYLMPIKKWKPNVVRNVLILCGLVGISGVTGNLYDAALSSGMIAVQGSDYGADSSARIAYILEVVFFAWIILKNYKKIEPTRENLIFLNMAWAFCAFLLLFVRSDDGGRVAWFFTMGIVYIVTLIATKLQYQDMAAKRIGANVGTLMIIVMLVLYVRVYFAWQATNALYPYKTFLTDGFRNPDWIRDHYEYDYNYDKDKFYRPAFRFLR